MMDTSEDREYEIEKICGQIVANGTTHYQSVQRAFVFHFINVLLLGSIQWKGFTAAERTWEVNVYNAFNLSHCCLCAAC
jgi:hypothetical protein